MDTETDMDMYLDVDMNLYLNIDIGGRGNFKNQNMMNRYKCSLPR
jgi:hypothetical protein